MELFCVLIGALKHFDEFKRPSTRFACCLIVYVTGKQTLFLGPL